MHIERIAMASLHPAQMNKPFISELAKHQPVWVKVNVQVDEGIAEIVSLLSQVDQLETVQSCEGYSDAPAYVYFHYGDWEQLCRFMFVTLGPEMHKRIGRTALISVEVFNGSIPLGKISFDRKAIPTVASVLQNIVQGQRENRTATAL